MVRYQKSVIFLLFLGGKKLASGQVLRKYLGTSNPTYNMGYNFKIHGVK